MLFTIELWRWSLSLVKFTLNGNVETFFDSTFADSLNRFYCDGAQQTPATSASHIAGPFSSKARRI